MKSLLGSAKIQAMSNEIAPRPTTAQKFETVKGILSREDVGQLPPLETTILGQALGLLLLGEEVSYFTLHSRSSFAAMVDKLVDFSDDETCESDEDDDGGEVGRAACSSPTPRKEMYTSSPSLFDILMV